MELSWNDVNLKKVNIIVSKSQMNSFVEVVGNSVGKDEFILTENGKKLKTTQNKEGINLINWEVSLLGLRILLREI